jgi:hypothetical protein
VPGLDICRESDTKTAIFFIASLPQYIYPGHGPQPGKCPSWAESTGHRTLAGLLAQDRKPEVSRATPAAASELATFATLAFTGTGKTSPNITKRRLRERHARACGGHQGRGLTKPASTVVSESSTTLRQASARARLRHLADVCRWLTLYL